MIIIAIIFTLLIFALFIIYSKCYGRYDNQNTPEEDTFSTSDRDVINSPYHQDVSYYNGVPYPPLSDATRARLGLLPWNNTTRFTKNMSYDIRGDIPPYPYYTGPFNYSPIAPIPYY